MIRNDSEMIRTARILSVTLVAGVILLTGMAFLAHRKPVTSFPGENGNAGLPNSQGGFSMVILTDTPMPTSIPVPPGTEILEFKYSWYNPAKGGVNCGHWVEGVGCTSHMANGERWQDYIDRDIAIACPPQYPFETAIVITAPPEAEGRYLCKDRGGKIKGNFLDFLTSRPAVPFQSAIFGYVED